MKKIIAIVLAVCAICSLSTVAFADAELFDWNRTIFIGDSQTGAMSIYNAHEPFISQESFLYQNGLSVCKFAQDIDRLLVLEAGSGNIDLVENSGADVICLMFGLNDIGHDIQECMTAYETVLAELSQRYPECTIIVQSVTPVTEDYRFSNEDIVAFNRVLKALCEKQGVQFFSIRSALLTDDGDLRPEFTHDGIHLNDAGCERWRTTLHEKLSGFFAAQK